MPPATGAYSESDEIEGRLTEMVLGLQDRFDIEDIGAADDGSPAIGGLTGVRLDEVKQHLFDLEYLEETELEIEQEMPSPALVEGLNAFLSDAQALFPAELAAAGRSVEAEDPWATGSEIPAPSAVGLELLRQLQSFDGENPLDSMPRFGEEGLHVRILHFQLKRLHLYRHAVANPYSADTGHALTMLASLLSIDRNMLLGVLGDVRELLSVAARKLSNAPLVYRGVVDTDGDLDFEDLRIRNGEFETRSWFFGRLLGMDGSWDDEPGQVYGSAEERLTSLENISALRFLQLGLWNLGFYGGRLDGFWGPESHTALLQAIETYNLEQDRALRRVDGGFIALNFQFLVSNLFGPDRVTEGGFQHQLDFVDRETAETSEESEPPQVEKGLWRQVKDGIRKALRLGRRVVVGVRSLLKSAVDGLRNGVHWLGDQLARLVGPVRNFLVFAYRGAREGVHMLIRSIKPFLHFILRKPIATADDQGRPSAISKFDVDRDTVHWVADRASTAIVEEHAGLCRRLARALKFVLMFAGMAIDALLKAATGPVGWMRILVRALRRMIRAFSS